MTTYKFYDSEYGGKLSEEEFQKFQGRASAFLSALTLGRSEAVLLPWQDKMVQMAVCAVTDAMHVAENGGQILSESNDGISVSYAAKPQQTDEKRLYDAAVQYLAPTGLLYRGCL